MLTLAGTREHQDQWQAAIEATIGHQFNNPDLLEEALESPESGVMSVGSTHRDTEHGNKGLAHIGNAVMELVLKDQCYLLKYSTGKALSVVF